VLETGVIGLSTVSQAVPHMVSRTEANSETGKYVFFNRHLPMYADKTSKTWEIRLIRTV